ncbi:hypothetical protein BD779DRAFT_1674032 [Infundibulicybe gibba]|nr:hypothetical protein BD779DRAFT_1674032 [Infundibulicybe gibba]
MEFKRPRLLGPQSGEGQAPSSRTSGFQVGPHGDSVVVTSSKKSCAISVFLCRRYCYHRVKKKNLRGPKILIFNSPIFNLNDDPERPLFSPPWLLALELALHPYRAGIGIAENNLFPLPATLELDGVDMVKRDEANVQLLNWYRDFIPSPRTISPPIPDRKRPYSFLETPPRHERTEESSGYRGGPSPQSPTPTRILPDRRASRKQKKRKRSSSSE